MPAKSKSRKPHATRSDEEGAAYPRFELCPTLVPKKKCLRLKKYNRGQFTELFHEHFPSNRIAKGASLEMMKALVVRYEELDAAHILSCYLNERGQEPESCDRFQIKVEPTQSRESSGDIAAQTS